MASLKPLLTPPLNDGDDDILSALDPRSTPTILPQPTAEISTYDITKGSLLDDMFGGVTRTNILDKGTVSLGGAVTIEASLETALVTETVFVSVKGNPTTGTWSEKYSLLPNNAPTNLFVEIGNGGGRDTTVVGVSFEMRTSGGKLGIEVSQDISNSKPNLTLGASYQANGIEVDREVSGKMTVTPGPDISHVFGRAVWSLGHYFGGGY